MSHMKPLARLAVLVAALLLPCPALSGDGLVVLHELSITIGHDGIVRQKLRIETRLDSLFATNALADPRIRFDRTTQELGILRAATLLPDGTLLDAPSRALNTSVPDAVGWCPTFAGLSEVVVSFVGVEPGVVTILEYELVDKVARSGHFEYLAELASELPTRQVKVTLRLPGRLHFGWLPLGRSEGIVAEEPLLERADSVYTWTAKDLPALASPLGFPLAEDRPRLVFTTAEGWEPLLAPILTQMRPPLRLPRRLGRSGQADPQPPTPDPQPPTPSLAALLAAALPESPAPAGDATGLVQALGRLRDLVRMMPTPLLPDRHPLPRPLDMVAAARQATPLEAALLAAWLASRLDARPKLVLTLTGPAAEKPGEIPGPPALARLGHVWVEIPTPAGPLWLSADRMELSPILIEPPATTLLVLAPGRRLRVVAASSLAPHPAALVRFSALVEGNDKELHIRFSLAANGAASPFISQARAPAPDAAEVLAARLLGTEVTVLEATVTSASTGSWEMSGRAVAEAPAAAALYGTPGIELIFPFLDFARPGPRPLPGPLVYEQSVRFAVTGLEPVLPLARSVQSPGITLSTVLLPPPEAGFERRFVLDAVVTGDRPPAPLARFLDASRAPVLFVPKRSD